MRAKDRRKYNREVTENMKPDTRDDGERREERFREKEEALRRRKIRYEYDSIENEN